KKEWENLFGVPVSMENDANCAALAEVWHGAAKNIQHALFLIIGSGIGGSVVIDRKLFKGKDLFGGEFGYMLLDGEHTLSEMGSPVHTAERYGKEMGLDTVVDGKYLFKEADRGEPLAVKYVDGLIDALARGIYNLSISFNPDMVVIGGGISVREDLIQRLHERTSFYLERQRAYDIKLNIQVCEFHNDANLIGAVAHFEQTVYDKNNIAN
ncbi:MAG: ROK family protein, partial [Carnobacterium inhibens]